MGIITGINKANAIYACIWCTVAKDERYMYVHVVHTCINVVHTCIPVYLYTLHAWNKKTQAARYNRALNSTTTYMYMYTELIIHHVYIHV